MWIGTRESGEVEHKKRKKKKQKPNGPATNFHLAAGGDRRTAVTGLI